MLEPTALTCAPRFSHSRFTTGSAAEGRSSDSELTVFKSLGLAVEDLAAAEHVLRRAEEENAGTVVSL